MQNEEKIIGMIQDLGTTLGGQIKALDAKMTGMNSDIGAIKTDVAALKTDVAVLKTDVAALKMNVGDLQESQGGIIATIAEMDTYMRTELATKADLAQTNARVTRLEQLQGIA